jgi:hypothetical protein
VILAHVRPIFSSAGPPFSMRAFCIASPSLVASIDILPSFSAGTPRAAASAVELTPAAASWVRIRRSSFTFWPVSASIANRLSKPSAAAPPESPMMAVAAATELTAPSSALPWMPAAMRDLPHASTLPSANGSAAATAERESTSSSPDSAPVERAANVAARASFSCETATHEAARSHIVEIRIVATPTTTCRIAATASPSGPSAESAAVTFCIASDAGNALLTRPPSEEPICANSGPVSPPLTITSLSDLVMPSMPLCAAFAGAVTLSTRERVNEATTSNPSSAVHGRRPAPRRRFGLLPRPLPCLRR